jgi:DNA-binding NarL/FixJ family response regulator
VHCSENAGELFPFFQKYNPTLLIARADFIQNGLSSKFSELIREVSVLAVLDSDSPQVTSELLRIGFRGVVEHHCSPELLIRSALAVISGELWAPRRIISTLVSDLLRAESEKQTSVLTPREACILELTLNGYTNSEIASKLFISHATVRWHKRRLYRKIGRSDSDLTAEDIRRVPAASESGFTGPASRLGS